MSNKTKFISNGARKILLVIALLTLPVIASAEGFVPLAPIPGLTDVAANSEGLANFFNNLYKYLIGLAAVLAVIEIIWGGLEISTKDSVSKQSDGKERITQAIFGLVLVLSPVLVFSIINPSILNLSLNLPELKMASRIPAGFVGGQTAPATITNGPGQGCVVSGVVLKKATCPSLQTAEDWESSFCTTGTSIVDCSTVTPSGACASTTVTCETISKTFMFLDQSWNYNPIQIFSNYQPLASTPDNPNNGSEAVQFINGCTQDGGLTCLTDKDFFSSDCSTYYTSNRPANQSNKCYYAKLTCIPNEFLKKSSECSSSPSYTPVQ